MSALPRALLCCCWMLALVPALTGQAPYLPLHEGHQWIFDTEFVTQAPFVEVRDSGVVTATCVRVDRIGDQDWYAVAFRSDNGKLDGTMWVRCDGDTVQVSQASEGNLLLLPTNSAEGARRDIRVAGELVALQGWSQGAPETVVTPAGSHAALPVAATLDAPVTRVQTRVWYARGVGPVKIVESVRAPATEVRRILTLRSFTLCDKDQTGEFPPPPPPVTAKDDATVQVTPPDAFELVRTIAATGGSEAEWSRLASLARTLWDQGQALADGKLPDSPYLAAQASPVQPAGAHADEVKGARIATAGVSAADDVKRSILVVGGPIRVAGDLKGCAIFALGAVRVLGDATGSLIVTSEAVAVADGVKESMVVTPVAVSVGGDLRRSVVEAGQATVDDDCADSVFVNLPAPEGGKGNLRVDLEGSPLRLLGR